MKKFILLFVVLALTVAFASTSYAYIWSSYPLNGDEIYTYDRYSWDGWNHTYVYYKNCDYTAVQVIIDPDGVPWMYYYGVFNYYYYTLDIYYSYDGWNWYYLGYAYI